MKRHLAAAALCALLVGPSPAQTGDGKAPGAATSRTVSVSTRAPDPAKWQSSSAANGAKRVFKCKPLACLAPETVAFTFQKGSLVTPNAQALDKFATVDLPKNIRAAVTDTTEKVDTLFSATTTVKSYPAVLNETKFSRPPKEIFVETAIIFTGPVIIRVESNSPNRELAKNSLSEFLAVMQIHEGPAPPELSAPSPPKTQNL